MWQFRDAGGVVVLIVRPLLQFARTICMFSLVIFTSRSGTIRRLFWDGPRNFERWPDDEDHTSAGTHRPKFRTTPVRGHLTPLDLACIRPGYT
ncbi:hypothetical protein AVEN_83896-1 [Araneus ventricosus]|uniref:Uncharacterized protein n=1 Tax=Araneus ventricosus TaxID=182803 RepID=A0A4Y2PEP6_ARAVE|nr:hypothetical protein AVEN_83896-1 [Araneus ventricosus]